MDSGAGSFIEKIGLILEKGVSNPGKICSFRDRRNRKRVLSVTAITSAIVTDPVDSLHRYWELTAAL